MGILNSFINFNQRLSSLCDLKNIERSAHAEYFRLATLLFSASDVKRIMDIAAGSNWRFPIAYKSAYGLELSGVDIDADAINSNNALDFRFIGDVCRSSEIGAGKYDLLTCYSGIEHFSDVQRFLHNGFTSLRPGGALIAQFPSSLAPFAILNRVLPQNFKKKLLNILLPSGASELGYPAFYNNCRYTAFKKAAERSGFEIEHYLCSHISSGYFSWFIPLFLLSQLLDIIRLITGIRDLASYNLFILRRPGEHITIKY